MLPSRVVSTFRFRSPRKHHLSPAFQVIFNDCGSMFCSYSSEHIDCYHFMNGWVNFFSWSVCDIQLDPNESRTDWMIDKVHFTRASKRTSLCVIILNRFLDLSFLYMFPDISRNSSFFAIRVRGLISSCEYIPPGCPASHTGSPTYTENATIDDTMDISESETARISRTQPVTNLFQGCMAVGFHQGQAGILDLRLDRSLQNDGIAKPRASAALERSQLLDILQSGCSLRLSDDSMDTHTLVYLDASVVRWAEFHYKSVSGKLLNSVPATQTYVSALRYIPNSETLVVGFSFGGWQLWSLYTLELLYSLRQLTIHAPVEHITFQEPSDDPRFCCYLWIGWQSRSVANQSQQNSQDSTKLLTNNAEARLYQLSYLHRREDPRGDSGSLTYRYQELIGLSERLFTTLWTADTTGATRLGNQLLDIRSLRSQPALSSSRICATNLVSILWRISPHVIRIGLFDLDCWYHAQMPTRICTDNSFFTVFDAKVPDDGGFTVNGHVISATLIPFLCQVTARDRHLSTLCEPIKDGKIPQSLSFNSTLSAPPPTHAIPEVCLRPSALSFTFLLAWNRNQSGDFPMTSMSTLHFTSRQDACLNILTTHLQDVANSEQSCTAKGFEITDWISEAWVTGLLESPNLDIVCEEELGRLVQLSFELASQPAKRCYTDSEFEQAGLRLAYGDELDGSLFDELNELMSFNQDSSARPAKKAKLQMDSCQADSGRFILCPSWVLLANCLLDRGQFNVLKSLEQLASGCGPFSPTNLKFRCSWLWSRFRRCKAKFDRLTCCLFDATSEDVNTSTPSTSYELSSVVFQLQLLGQLSKCWFNSSALQASPFWMAIQTYAAYARLVAFFCRLGLLPQQHNVGSVNASKDLEELAEEYNAKNTVLCPYNPDLFDHAIQQLLFRHTSTDEAADSDQAINLPISDALLRNCLDSTTGSTDLKIWHEQEQLTGGSVNSLPRYPPRRLQALCTLWQLSSDQNILLRRLSLLAFLLFDATAVVTLVRRQASKPEENRKRSPLLAIKLCNRVILLFCKEFPVIRSLLPTIFVLWMVERGFFKEVLDINLTSALLGSSFAHQKSPFINLFPEQMTVLVNHLRSNDQLHLLHELRKLFHFEETPFRYTTLDMPSTNLQPAGSLFLLLSRIRHYLRKLRTLCAHDPDLLSKEGHNVLIKLSELCRRSGRLGDLVTLGLTHSEVQALFDHYRDSGQYVLLFHCLLARKQYEAALTVYKDYQKAESNKHVSELLCQPAKSLDAPKHVDVDVITKLLTKSLPPHHEDFQVCSVDSQQDSLDPLLASFLADSAMMKATDQDAIPLPGVAYRRVPAVQCPLTSCKADRLQVSTMDNQDVYTPVHFRRSTLEASTLLDTAKKSSSEFWETFSVLENLRATCNMSTRYSRYSTSFNDSKLDLSSGFDKLKPHRKTDRLFKLIYTPPPKRQPSRLDSVKNPCLELGSTRSQQSTGLRKPISILKSPGLSCSRVMDHCSTTESASSLNVTLDDDADVTLNLSTVRPSTTTLSGTPIIASVQSQTSSKFVFSPPHVVSSKAKFLALSSCTTSDSQFQFATPLSRPLVAGREVDPAAAPKDYSSDMDLTPVSRPRVPNKEVAQTAAPKDDAVDMEVTLTGSREDRLVHPQVHRSAETPKIPVEVPEVVKVSEVHDQITDMPLSSTDVSMDLDDASSISSSVTEPSFSLETPRRSARRSRPPKRYDPSKF